MVSYIVSAIIGGIIRHFSPAVWNLAATKFKAAWAKYRTATPKQ